MGPMRCPVMCQAMANVPSPLWPFWPLFRSRPLCQLRIRWALALALTLARRLRPGTQPRQPEQPCRHLHLQTKTPLLRLGTSTTIPTATKTEPPFSPRPPGRLGAKLFGDCYSQCFFFIFHKCFVFTFPPSFFLSLSFALPPLSRLSCLFWERSWRKQWLKNKFQAPCWERRRGGEGNGYCLLQQHLCHSFCTSQTRPGPKGRGGKRSPTPKGSVPLIKCLQVDWSNPLEWQTFRPLNIKRRKTHFPMAIGPSHKRGSRHPSFLHQATFWKALERECFQTKLTLSNAFGCLSAMKGTAFV